jgi:hypothetical protein
VRLPDELPELRELSESDWEIVEDLAARCRTTGDIMANAAVTTERCVQLLEMPAESVYTIVWHLAYLRRNDLVDGLFFHPDDVVARILQRQEQDRARDAAIEAAEQPTSRRSPADCEAAWEACKANPQAALEQLRAIVDGPGKPTEKGRLGARVLGVQLTRGVDYMAQVQERELELIALATPPAPEPGPTVEQELEQQARDWRAGLPTALSGIEAFEGAFPWDPWQQSFTHYSCFAGGESDARTIADRLGLQMAEVRLHAAQLHAREDLWLRQVAAAYSEPAELLRDAVEHGGWQRLGELLEVPAFVLQRFYVEITNGPASPAP